MLSVSIWYAEQDANLFGSGADDSKKARKSMSDPDDRSGGRSDASALSSWFDLNMAKDGAAAAAAGAAAGGGGKTAEEPERKKKETLTARHRVRLLNEYYMVALGAITTTKKPTARFILPRPRPRPRHRETGTGVGTRPAWEHRTRVARDLLGTAHAHV